MLIFPLIYEVLIEPIHSCRAISDGVGSVRHDLLFVAAVALHGKVIIAVVTMTFVVIGRQSTVLLGFLAVVEFTFILWHSHDATCDTGCRFCTGWLTMRHKLVLIRLVVERTA